MSHRIDLHETFIHMFIPKNKSKAYRSKSKTKLNHTPIDLVLDKIHKPRESLIKVEVACTFPLVVDLISDIDGCFENERCTESHYLKYTCPS